MGINNYTLLNLKNLVFCKEHINTFKKLINDLAYIYNYSEDDMKNIILSSLNERLLIDKTLLRKNARNS